MLHVTNGESVSIRDKGLPGRVLCWKDVLSEGPVPRGLPLRELSRVRERFIVESFQIPPEEVSFTERDETIERFRDHEEVVLWFEHDLFDQLQLIQILDWFSSQDLGTVRLALICHDSYLGPMRAEQLAPLFETRHTVAAAEFKTARAAWAAFCSPEPLGLAALLDEDTSALPFLRGALLRHLQQFPALRNGLARTERQILELVESGLRSFPELFLADQKLEECIFMGDLTFRQYLRGLAGARQPLLRADRGAFEPTSFGLQVLHEKNDHVRVNGINRWLGGVHLCEGAPIWRWDEATRSIRPSRLPGKPPIEGQNK
ncbi:MAG TPA: hypothetical protein VEU96_15440 [Bryobacteraceae bacterium]|nr:hypothetical protein [Bryobacteraceae bacterium]